MKVKQIAGLCIALITASLLMLPGLHAAGFDAEMAGGISMIQRIDAKKRIIYMNGPVITYDGNTQVYDKDGNELTVDQLKPGLAIRFDYNKSQRFITGPTATKIWLKSRYPMPVGN
jgi:hypothetical protein